LKHFNTFTIKELNQLLDDSFEEIQTVLRRYALPRDLDNLNLSSEVVDILRRANIQDLKEFLDLIVINYIIYLKMI
jgi:DNA-directed RNA polymerase subunit beta'